MNLIIEQMKQCGVVFEAGLTDSAIGEIEKLYDIQFPQSLRDFYSCALPVSYYDPAWEGFEMGREIFPVWNDFSDDNVQMIRQWINRPAEMLLLSVEHGFWRGSWGEKPLDAEKAKEICTSRLADAPKMIPVYLHRHIPQLAGVADPPVISAVGQDIVYYGRNLRDYLVREFLEDNSPRQQLQNCLNVPFWSDIINGNVPLWRDMI